jgi:osmotically-inducible protein OsmY
VIRTRPTLSAILHARRSGYRRASVALLSLASLVVLPGCAPLILGGAVFGTGMVVTDRRTTGTQIEDQAIESKATARAKALATLGRIDVHSYNRLVLITGEVPAAEDRARVEKAVAGVENVRSVVNELTVGPNASASTRAGDSLLEAKVKASFVDAKDLQAHALRVVAEKGSVYLMGRVTEREANRATEVARTIPGVTKVVKVFDILSETDLANLAKGNAPTGR